MYMVGPYLLDLLVSGMPQNVFNFVWCTGTGLSNLKMLGSKMNGRSRVSLVKKFSI